MKPLYGYEAQNARNMCKKHGTRLGRPGYDPNSEFYVVDGKVWLLCKDYCVMVRDYVDFCEEKREGLRTVLS